MGHNRWLTWQYYKSQQRQIISNILKRSQIRVACFSDQPNNIIGWLCYESIKIGATDVDIIHYIYVAARYRGKGAGKFLLAKTNALIKNRTNKVPRLYSSHAGPFIQFMQNKVMVIFLPELATNDTSGIIL
jgi:GNAT superfamily N-acetyltransferase